MEYRVPALSMVCMAFSFLFAFALPVVLCIWLRKKKKANLPPFFIGCAVMLLFALVLESIAHNLVLGSSIGGTIQGNTWLYALYGGLMAGLFEETGRFLAFKTVLKKYQSKDVNALMYGAGHGGFEAAALLGIAMLNNLILSVLINTNATQLVTSTLSGDTLAQVESAFEGLATSPPYVFLVGALERVFAVAIQMALSVLVWFAAKKKGRVWLYPLAILLHLAVDGVTVLLADAGLPMLALEAVVGLMAAGLALLGRLVWKKESEQQH